jgi:hypothetical protein
MKEAKGKKHQTPSSNDQIITKSQTKIFELSQTVILNLFQDLTLWINRDAEPSSA